jgi:hypothetical protein
MNVVVMSRIPLGMLYSYANPDSYIVDILDDDGRVQRQNFTNNRMLSVDVLGKSRTTAFCLQACT